MYNSPYEITPSNTYEKSAERARKNMETLSQYNKFCESVQNFLVSESIYSILLPCLEGKSDADKEYGRVLCEQFVQEEGSYSLLRRFNRESLMLHEMYLAIMESYDSIVCKMDKENNLTFSIKPSDKKDFYDKLSDVSTSEVCKKIAERSCKAAEEFIQANINDKLDMEEVAARTRERIDNIKADSDEKKKELQEECVRIGKQEMSRIAKRPKTLYECIIYSIANNVLTTEDEEVKSAFVNESGKVNIDIVKEKADVMYRFLETINTAKIKTIDESYMFSLLNSIK